MENTYLSCLSHYDQYILEAAQFQDEIIDDVVYKYRFPNNHGIMLVHHDKNSNSKWSVDFVVYDEKESNIETYVVFEDYNPNLESVDIYDDANICALFDKVFEQPMHVRINVNVKNAMQAMLKLTHDEKVYIVENTLNHTTDEQEAQSQEDTSIQTQQLEVTEKDFENETEENAKEFENNQDYKNIVHEKNNLEELKNEQTFEFLQDYENLDV